jgi:cytochrome o ubiquinol oxidase subunit 1
MNDTFDLTKFIFGRLSWGIDSLYDRSSLATLVGVVLGGLGLFDHDLLQGLGHAVA